MARVTIYMPDFQSGGVQRQHIRLAPVISRLGHDIEFVVHNRDGALAAQVGCGDAITSLDVSRAVSAIVPLSRYLARVKPDIVVANMGHPNLVALAANKLAGKPSKIVATQHNHLSTQTAEEKGWQHKVLPFLYRRFLRHADAIVAVSKGVADDLAEVSRVTRSRIVVIYNPAVPENVAALAAEAVDHPWFDGSVPVVIATGRLVPMKDFPTLLRALAKVERVRLVILGEGPQLKELLALADQLGVGERVDFAGFKPNPYSYMAKASVFALSSRYEGFGNVLAEALACGTPCVTTDCKSGPSEILADGAYGTLIPVGDVDALARALIGAIATPAAPERLIERGMCFSVDQSAHAYAALFDELHPARA